MTKLIEAIATVAVTDTTVLICGETERAKKLPLERYTPPAQKKTSHS